MGFVSYQLSTPPSVNKLWKPKVTNKGGRTKAIVTKRPAYAIWLETAGWEIATLGMAFAICWFLL